MSVHIRRTDPTMLQGQRETSVETDAADLPASTDVCL